MAKNEIKIRITDGGTTAKYAKGMKKADQATERFRLKTSGLTRTVGALRNKLLLVTFATAALSKIMKDVITAAGEQEAAEKTLEVALGRVSQRLLDQAGALQQVSRFGDETIIRVQAILAAFIDSEDQIAAATAATLDFASAMGFDLKSAGDLVAKTLGSSTNALTRYGIKVEGAVGSTERLESLTTNVAQLFGGQAAAAAETMTGRMEQASNAVGDTAEAFGLLLAPAIKTAAEGLKTFAENMTTVIKEMDNSNRVVLSFGDSLGIIVSRFLFGAGKITIWTEAARLALEKITDLAVASVEFSDAQAQVTAMTQAEIDALNDLFDAEFAAAEAAEQLAMDELSAAAAALEFEYESKKAAAAAMRVADALESQSTQAMVALNAMSSLSRLMGGDAVSDFEKFLRVATDVLNILAAIKKIEEASKILNFLATGDPSALLGFASGGVSPGGPILVGERGPEIISPPAGTRIFNNQDSRQMMGSRTINLVVDGEVLASVIERGSELGHNNIALT